MKKILQPLGTQDGYVLVLAMMMMLVLTLLGIAATNTTTTEQMIAGNDTLHKKTFYRADGGTEIAASVLEENIACITGFTATTGTEAVLEGAIRVTKLNLWQIAAPNDPPTDASRDLYFPEGYTAGQPHTNVTIGGQTEMTTGSALQMAAGYEGKGKGIGAGGTHLLYDVYAQHLDFNNAESLVHVQWRHTVGQEGDCNY
jgi:Tfp pilus assembly protein PilX